MTEYRNIKSLTSLAIRTIAIVNIGVLIIDTVWPYYVAFLRHGITGRVVVGWFIVTSLLLPILGVLQVRHAASNTVGRGSAIVDAALATAWLASFWLAVFYAFAHTPII